jgi:hypothetical protein
MMTKHPEQELEQIFLQAGFQQDNLVDYDILLQSQQLYFHFQFSAATAIQKHGLYRCNKPLAEIPHTVVGYKDSN